MDYPLPYKPRLRLPYPDEYITTEQSNIFLKDGLLVAPPSLAFSYQFFPESYWHYVFKHGMSGNGVAVLQLNLGSRRATLPVDGDFGDKTELAVRNFQDEHLGLDEVDGIAGGATQRKLCLVRSVAAEEEFGLPQRMLSSMLQNESGYFVEAYSRHPSDNGYDIGAYQLSIGGTGGRAATQENFWLGYDIKRMAESVASRARSTRDHYADPSPGQYLTDLAKGDKWKFSWMLAVLTHNWPYAAEHIYQYGSIHSDNKDDAYSTWVVAASGGRLTTEREWVESYIDRATVYVRWT